MNDVKNTIKLLKSGLGREETIKLLTDANQSVRGSAVQSLAEKFGGDQMAINAIREFIDRTENRKPAMGAVSLNYLAMKLLANINSSAAKNTFDDLRKAWPEPDRSDLEWFLLHG